MKRILFWLTAVALLMTACQKPEKEDNTKDPVSGEKTFNATLSALTKVSVGSDGLALTWSKADKVSVFDGKGNQMFRSQGSGASAELLGNAYPADTYYALYPYDASASINGSIIQTLIPAQQTASAGGADLQVLAVAKSTGSDLAFSPVSAVVKFTLDAETEGVSSVKLKAEDGALAGAVSIDCGGRPALTAGSSSASVSVTAFEGTFKSGGSYYVAVLPGQVGKLVLTYTVGSDEMEVSAENVNLVAGGVYELPKLPRAMTAEEKAFLGSWTLLKYGSRGVDGTVGSYPWVNVERGYANPEVTNGDYITFKSDGSVEMNLGDNDDTYLNSIYDTHIVHMTGKETWALVKEDDASYIQFGGNAFPLFLGDLNGIGAKYRVVHVTETEMLLEIAYNGDEGPAVAGIFLQPKGKETYVHSFRIGDFGIPEGEVVEELAPLVDGNITWEALVDADVPVYYMNPNAGLMMGRAWVAGQSARGAKLWSDSFATKKISSVTVTTARFAPEEGTDTSAADVSVYVGDTKIGTSYSIVNDMTSYTFDAKDPISGKLEVRWETTNDQINCYFVKSILVVYEN